MFISSNLFVGLIMTFSLTSKDFKEEEMIPKKFTCMGKDISPSLQWASPPKGTQSLALTIVDPDAPRGKFVHWIIYNIPPTANELSSTVIEKSIEGMNDFGNLGYGGPCPPKRQKHAYIFTLYALDTVLSLNSGILYDELIKAMQGHILAETNLTGFFSKS